MIQPRSADMHGHKVPRIKEWLKRHFTAVTQFKLVTFPYEGPTHYPVAIVEADGAMYAVKWHAKPEALQNEVAAIELLVNHSVPVARVVDVDLCVPVIVLEYLPGRAMGPSDVTDERIIEIARILRGFHEVVPKEDITGHIPRWPGKESREINRLKFEERLGARPYLDPALADAAERAGRSLLDQLTWQHEPRLMRRDMHPENWYLHRSGQLYAIDHRQATFGDILYDLNMVVHDLRLTERQQQVFARQYGEELFRQATLPHHRALIYLQHGLGIVGWLKGAQERPTIFGEAIEVLIKPSINVALNL